VRAIPAAAQRVRWISPAIVLLITPATAAAPASVKWRKSANAARPRTAVSTSAMATAESRPIWRMMSRPTESNARMTWPVARGVKRSHA